MLVRGFHILFPMVYRRGDVYFTVDGEEMGLNWLEFKDLVRDHEVLLRRGILQHGRRPLDRQAEILSASEVAFNKPAFSAPSSSEVEVHSQAAGLVESRTRLTKAFTFLLPHCEARYADMKRLRDESEKYLEQALDNIGSTLSISDLVRKLRVSIREYKEKLRLKNKADDAMTYPPEDSSDKDIALLICDLTAMSEHLDRIVNAQRAVDTLEKDSWVIRAAIRIMKSSAVIDLIDDPLYGLPHLHTVPRSSGVICEMYRPSSSQDADRQQAEDLLEMILVSEGSAVLTSDCSHPRLPSSDSGASHRGPEFTNNLRHSDNAPSVPQPPSFSMSGAVEAPYPRGTGSTEMKPISKGAPQSRWSRWLDRILSVFSKW